ncbi:S10 family peptidase [Aquipuribacter nitratireducens]|uniref:S10 family peptidase n=1 Tax=Aquipuribacter nitratireducens TaxID=650104 RepID=A0ABW0GQA4_9MICO
MSEETTPDPGPDTAHDDATAGAGTAPERPSTTTTLAEEPADTLVTTEHTLATGTGDLRYRARSGRLVLRRETSGEKGFEGHTAVAEIAVTSYEVLDGGGSPDPARPVTFVFNGGPGASSVWLHLGLLGPRRVVLGDAGDLLPPPGRLADNPQTLLAVSDLVFIDPVSTGWSRVRSGRDAKEFHGYGGDVESVSELIRLWTTRNDRWLSPKLLAGESYGTLRAVAVASHLQQRHHLHVNGIMLISMVLDMGTIRFHPGDDRAYVGFLPTYAAIAHYHGAAGQGVALADHLAAAADFARGAYAAALAAGSHLDAEERARVVARAAELTGLSEDYLDRAGLRVEHQRFYAELLRHERKVVGRLDGRFVGHEDDAVHERPSVDPFITATGGPYTAAYLHYSATELGYRNDLPYKVLSELVHPWSYKEFEGRAVSVTEDLGALLRRNPHLRVHVACGYYDGATPFAAAEDTVAQLRVPAEALERVETAYYESGHMMYLHEPSRLQQCEDLRAFVARATG